MNQPIAWFVTWTTYGTWLHGDPRGSWDQSGTYVVPDERRRMEAAATLLEEPVTLTEEQRAIVNEVIVQHCALRGWILHARSVRTQHVHAVVSAAVDGKVIRAELKKWASVRLSQHAGLKGVSRNGVRRWWTERGNIEAIWDDRGLAAAIQYVEDQ